MLNILTCIESLRLPWTAMGRIKSELCQGKQRGMKILHYKGVAKVSWIFYGSCQELELSINCGLTHGRWIALLPCIRVTLWVVLVYCPFRSITSPTWVWNSSWMLDSKCWVHNKTLKIISNDQLWSLCSVFSSYGQRHIARKWLLPWNPFAKNISSKQPKELNLCRLIFGWY